MDEARKKEIAQKLTEKGAVLPCPRCGHREFTIIDGYTVQSVQPEPTGLTLGGSGVPMVVTACTNCGFVSFHALGALEPLPKQEVPK